MGCGEALSLFVWFERACTWSAALSPVRGIGYRVYALEFRGGVWEVRVLSKEAIKGIF